MLMMKSYLFILALALFSFLNISTASLNSSVNISQKIESTQDYFLKTNSLNQLFQQHKLNKELNKTQQPINFDLVELNYNFNLIPSYQLNKIVFFYSLIPYDHCLIGKNARAPPTLYS